MQSPQKQQHSADDDLGINIRLQDAMCLSKKEQGLLQPIML